MEYQKLISPEYAITNAVGKACLDYRIMAGINLDEDDSGFVGPFKSEAEFNHILRCGALPDITHRTGHAIVFTHADLNMRNILVDGGEPGLVDWENSGWYPEYWAHKAGTYEAQAAMAENGGEIFAGLGSYSEELEIEYSFWHHCF